MESYLHATIKATKDGHENIKTFFESFSSNSLVEKCSFFEASNKRKLKRIVDHPEMRQYFEAVTVSFKGESLILDGTFGSFGFEFIVEIFQLISSYCESVEASFSDDEESAEIVIGLENGNISIDGTIIEEAEQEGILLYKDSLLAVFASNWNDRSSYYGNITYIKGSDKYHFKGEILMNGKRPAWDKERESVIYYNWFVDENPWLLKNKELSAIALKYSPIVLQYIPSKFIDASFCEIAVKYDPDLLEYVPDSLKTRELCEAAIEGGLFSIAYVPVEWLSEDIVLERVKEWPSVFKYLKIKTQVICDEAVKGWVGNFEYVPNEFKTNKLCEFAIDKDPSLKKFLP